MKNILYLLGIVMRYFSFFLLLPLIYASVTGEKPLIYLIAFLFSLILGVSLTYGTKFFNLISDKPLPLESITLRQGFMLTAASFIVLTAISSIPFLPHLSILNSIFEATSGITTTGLSVFSNLDAVPKSLLLWRSLTQWIGGIGIVIVFFFIIYRMRVSEERSHSTGVSASSALYATFLQEKVSLGMKKTAANILFIYLTYTGLGIILLYLAGLNIFEAFNMSLTSISTGGFTVTNSFYTNPAPLAVLSFLMILGSTSFFMHARLFQKKIKEFFINIEGKVFLILLAIFFLISSIAFRKPFTLLFELISAMTTTGFTTTQIAVLPQIVILCIFLAMIIGGSMGSTSGGIKIFRFITLIKALPWMIRKLSVPKTAIIPFKISGKSIDTSLVLITEIFISGYLIFALLGTILFMGLGFSFLDASFQVISSLSTVGLSTIPVITIPWVGKIFLVLAMLLGRLEIFPLLILIRKLWR